MSNTHIRVNLSGLGGTDDKKLKVSTNDTFADFLDGKIVVGSTKIVKTILSPGGAETLEIDLDETKINHDNIMSVGTNTHSAIDSHISAQDGIHGVTGDVVGTTDSQALSNKTIGNTNTITVIDSNLTIQDNGDNTKQIKFEASSVTTGTTRTITMPDADLTLIGAATTDTLTNKTIDADNNTISNLAHGAEVDDPSSGVHGVTGSVVGTTDSQTLTNKSIDADNNTITNLENDNIKSMAAIDAAKLADGSVSNAEFQRLDGVTSDIQTQLNARLVASSGDINETSFAGAQSASGANVTGLAFSGGTVRGFEAIVTVTVDATAGLFEEYKLRGVQKGATWDISSSSVGDTSGVDFDISSSGQVTYDSTAYAGFVSLAIAFRSLTTTV